ncbi:MAG: hypothetical protein R2854_30150 [Caldilineaceae bacterium]
MSKFVRVQTELRDVTLVKRALDELDLRYREDAVYTHRWTGHEERVRFLVDAPAPTFGLRAGVTTASSNWWATTWACKAAPDVGPHSAALRLPHRAGRGEFVGFDLVTSAAIDQVIRLTVRRWS